MKYVIGIVPVQALESVTDALGRAEIYRLTASEVEVIDTVSVPPTGSLGADPGSRARGDDPRRLRLEVAVNDAFLEPALRAFEEAEEVAGPVWVSVLPLEDVIRIRTGETGGEAI